MFAPGCARDERGAIMLVALVFAVLALSLVYAVIGTAEIVWFREHMQDAADAAALGSAISMARSMNFLVLINIVMAALLAILVTIKLLEGLAIIGMGIASAVAWFTAGASLVAIPPLNVVKGEMETLYDATKPPVFTALQVLHDVAGVVRDVAPIAATLMVETDPAYRPRPVTAEVVVPATLTLPVEDDTFKELCGKAGAMPVGIADGVLTPLGLGPVLAPLKGAMGDMTSDLATWFCGDDVPPPSFKQPTAPVYPKAPAGCDPVPQTGVAEAPTTAACEAAQRFEEQAKPDPKTGNCDPASDCSKTGPYEQSVAAARSECDPSRQPAPTKYWYQERTGTVTYAWSKAGWVRGVPRYGAPTERSSVRPPCGPAATNPLIDGYNLVVHQSSGADVAPVCTNETAPKLGPRGASPAEREVTFTEISQILACQKSESVQANVAIGEQGSGGKNADGAARAPKKVRDGVSLGDESFQLRAIAEGDLAALGATEIVRLASWRRAPPGAANTALGALGAYAFAQAEYFYDGSDDRGDWMWNMKWRARLRRFRLPVDAATGAFRAACKGTAATTLCDALFGKLSSLAEVSVH